jgi:hypothetical protein
LHVKRVLPAVGDAARPLPKKLQRQTQHECGGIAAGDAADQAHDPRPERTDDAANRSRQSRHGAEVCRLELAMNDQRRQRNEVADGKPINGAGDKKDSRVHAA